MPSLYTVETITDIKQAIMLENEWRTLIEATAEKKESVQCFMSWEWLTQWLQTYQDYIVELKIMCVLYNGTYVAIAPFYICTNSKWGITAKTLSFIATNEPENCEVASEFIDIAYSTQHKQKIIELLSFKLSHLTDITQFNFRI